MQSRLAHTRSPGRPRPALPGRPRDRTRRGSGRETTPDLRQNTARTTALNGRGPERRRQDDTDVDRRAGRSTDGALIAKDAQTDGETHQQRRERKKRSHPW